MFARTIELPRATSKGWLLATVAASIGSVVLAGLQPERMWYFVCLLIGSWASYWHTARRPSPLAFDSDGLVYEKHPIRWADVASIEPPSANGEITLRLRRALPDRLDPGIGGGKDWLLLRCRKFALDPLGVYTLLVGMSREAAWLLGAPDDGPPLAARTGEDAAIDVTPEDRD
ncbi:MAG: hypothetical protein NXI31_22040 [bacterium]|nr:hypothetical protein [bacterium]